MFFVIHVDFALDTDAVDYKSNRFDFEVTIILEYSRFTVLDLRNANTVPRIEDNVQDNTDQCVLTRMVIA